MKHRMTKIECKMEKALRDLGTGVVKPVNYRVCSEMKDQYNLTIYFNCWENWCMRTEDRAYPVPDIGRCGDQSVMEYHWEGHNGVVRRDLCRHLADGLVDGRLCIGTDKDTEDIWLTVNKKTSIWIKIKGFFTR